MKKVFKILSVLVLVLSLALTSCNSRKALVTKTCVTCVNEIIKEQYGIKNIICTKVKLGKENFGEDKIIYYSGTAECSDGSELDILVTYNQMTDYVEVEVLE